MSVSQPERKSAVPKFDSFLRCIFLELHSNWDSFSNQYENIESEFGTALFFKIRVPKKSAIPENYSFKGVPKGSSFGMAM